MAVTQYGYSLKFASLRLQDCEEIVRDCKEVVRLWLSRLREVHAAGC